MVDDNYDVDAYHEQEYDRYVATGGLYEAIPHAPEEKRRELEELHAKYLGDFAPLQKERRLHIAGTLPEILELDRPFTLPVAFEQLLDYIIIDGWISHIYYLDHMQLLSLIEYLHEGIEALKDRQQYAGYASSAGPHGQTYLLGPYLFPWIDDNERAKQITNDQTHLLHFLLSLMMLNGALSTLKDESIETIPPNYILTMQQCYEHAKAVKAKCEVITAVSDYVEPEEVERLIMEQRQKARQHLAAAGGKRKNESEFGESKRYVQRRLDQMLSEKPDLRKNATELSRRLMKELERECGTSLDADCPRERTLYKWVRDHLKIHSA